MIWTEDLKALTYAGMMGHEYTGVSGYPGERRISCECNSLKSAERLMKGEVNPEVYRKFKGKWTACSSIDLPVTPPNGSQERRAPGIRTSA